MSLVHPVEALVHTSAADRDEANPLAFARIVPAALRLARVLDDHDEIHDLTALVGNASVLQACSALLADLATDGRVDDFAGPDAVLIGEAIPAEHGVADMGGNDPAIRIGLPGTWRRG